jgi:hypothetical protein
MPAVNKNSIPSLHINILTFIHLVVPAHTQRVKNKSNIQKISTAKIDILSICFPKRITLKMNV